MLQLLAQTCHPDIALSADGDWQYQLLSNKGKTFQAQVVKKYLKTCVTRFSLLEFYFCIYCHHLDYFSYLYIKLLYAIQEENQDTGDRKDIIAVL